MQTRYLSLALACAFALLLAIPSGAIPVQNSFTLTSVDWTSASIGGIGGGCGIGGTANLTVSGINGPVTHAYLYWHGIDNYGANCATPQDAVAGRAGAMDYAGGTRTNACDGIYDVATIQFNGSAVTGTSLGDATTNCWGGGSSRAYRAEVTSLVTGNGVYTLAAMVSGPCDDINGASLIVTFDDGNDLNNRDLVFFEGNDSNIASGFPGEDDGWHALLDGITYSAGTAFAQLHLADGQRFDPAGLDDNTLTFSTGGPALVIPDAYNRYDGLSVQDAGFSRSIRQGTAGLLWDTHTFDLSSLFGAPGTYALTMDGQMPYSDCTGLVLLIINLEAGAAPVPARNHTWGSLKAIYR